MSKKPPLTDLERQKGFNVRKTHENVENMKTRDLMSKPEYKHSNTRGNPKTKK